MYKSIMSEQKPLKIFTNGKYSSNFIDSRPQNALDQMVVTVNVHALVVQSSNLPRPQDTRFLPRLALAALDIYLLVKVQAPTG